LGLLNFPPSRETSASVYPYLCAEVYMIFGLSIQTFTVIHVIISLLAIASGITRIHAGDRYRHSLADPAGTRAVCALQQASLRRLAMDLSDDPAAITAS